MDDDPKNYPNQLAMQVAAAEYWGPQRIADILDAVYHAAVVGEPVFNETGEQIGTKPSVAAQKLALSYAKGTPRREAVKHPVQDFDAAALDSLDGCRAAAIAIMKMQASGILDADAAASYRSTVELAIRTHTAAGGASVADSLAEMASLPFFAEAGREVESFKAYIEAHTDD